MAWSDGPVLVNGIPIDQAKVKSIAGRVIRFEAPWKVPQKTPVVIDGTAYVVLGTEDYHNEGRYVHTLGPGNIGMIIGKEGTDVRSTGDGSNPVQE